MFEATERAPEFQVAVNMRLDSTVKSWDSAHYEKLGENKASEELLQKYPTKKINRCIRSRISRIENYKTLYGGFVVGCCLLMGVWGRAEVDVVVMQLVVWFKRTRICIRV